MEILLVPVVGVLVGTSVYLLLRRNLVKIVLGLAMLSNAANLVIFTAARLTRGAPPIIAADATTLEAPYADPLPQALILTAIVISFGVTAFAVVLLYRTYVVLGTDDPDEMTDVEELDPPLSKTPDPPGDAHGHAEGHR